MIINALSNAGFPLPDIGKYKIMYLEAKAHGAALNKYFNTKAKGHNSELEKPKSLKETSIRGGLFFSGVGTTIVRKFKSMTNRHNRDKKGHSM